MAKRLTQISAIVVPSYLPTMTFFLANNHQDIVWELVFERGVNFARRPIPTLIVIDSFERGHLNTQSIAICTRFPRILESTYIFVIDISLSLITFIYYTSFREIFLDLIETPRVRFINSLFELQLRKRCWYFWLRFVSFDSEIRIGMILFPYRNFCELNKKKKSWFLKRMRD